jgi:hypothetical protein
MEQHGIGRLRRALEKLGLSARKISFATGQPIPNDCTVVIDANPRTRYSPGESEALSNYLARGGAAMLLVEPDYVLDESLAALLARTGIRIGNGVIVDPKDHYFTDEQMIAVSRYGAHPVTRGLSLSFYPGARPLEMVPAPDASVVPLAVSSAESYVISDRLANRRDPEAGPPVSRIIAVASEGRIGEQAKPFRLIVAGDADFASNSFFPYLGNSDVLLASIGWLSREERAPTMKPPVEVLPTVTLTGEQTRGIFIVTVMLMPGLIAFAGGIMWWRRR